VTPKVSVIIPMLDARAYVADTLDGVFGQTVPPYEVIVVDNGSTDGSPAFVRERYPWARVISEPLPGPSAARNAGAAAACGDFLAFCDSDDVWLPWKLERQMAAFGDLAAVGETPGLLASPTLLLIPDDEIPAAYADWSRRRAPRPVRPCRVGLGELLMGTSLMPSSAVLRRDIFESVGGFDPALTRGEDPDLWLRVARAATVFRLDLPVYLHRDRPGSLSSRLDEVVAAQTALLRRWSPERQPGLIPAGLHRRACSKQMLSLAYRHGRAGQKPPARLFTELTLDGPFTSPYGFGLWWARRCPGLFILACRIFALQRRLKRR